jgi:ketosteroid isomerase-like protein
MGLNGNFDHNLTPYTGTDFERIEGCLRSWLSGDVRNADSVLLAMMGGLIAEGTRRHPYSGLMMSWRCSLSLGQAIGAGNSKFIGRPRPMPSRNDAIELQSLHTGMDHIAKTMEAKWGVERLPLLVSPELRAKFERQREKTYAALEEAWHEDFVTRDQLERARAACGAMERAWAALDAFATQDRQLPIAAVTTVLEGRTHDGYVLAVVASDAEAGHVLREGRAMVVLTVEEVANLLKALGTLATDAKRLFPGTEIMPPSDRSWVKAGDPVPF